MIRVEYEQTHVEIERKEADVDDNAAVLFGLLEKVNTEALSERNERQLQNMKPNNDRSWNYLVILSAKWFPEVLKRNSHTLQYLARIWFAKPPI